MQLEHGLVTTYYGGYTILLPTYLVFFGSPHAIPMCKSLVLEGERDKLMRQVHF